MMTLHGRANSSNVQKVRWALAEMGLDYKHIERGRHYGGMDEDAFRALTPFALVPVLEHDRLSIFESGTILRYLARMPEAAAFWPEDMQDRLRAEGMMDWAGYTLWLAVRPRFVAVAREGMSRTDEALGRQVAAVAGPLMQLESALEEADWLAGDSFSFGDIPAAVVISRLVWLVGRQALPPRLGRWYDACAEREAFAAYVNVNE
ncbi:MAG: glutathione S-transferase family protein [Pseudomonadota bacterium]